MVTQLHAVQHAVTNDGVHVCTVYVCKLKFVLFLYFSTVSLQCKLKLYVVKIIYLLLTEHEVPYWGILAQGCVLGPYKNDVGQYSPARS